MSLIYGIVRLPQGLRREAVNKEIIEEKLDRLQQVIVQCRRGGFDRLVTYLTQAQGYLFPFLDTRYPGSKIVKTSSLVERVMREINVRIDVPARWSAKGSEHMIKLRLSVVYNHLDLTSLALSPAPAKESKQSLQAPKNHTSSENKRSYSPSGDDPDDLPQRDSG